MYRLVVRENKYIYIFTEQPQMNPTITGRILASEKNIWKVSVSIRTVCLSPVWVKKQACAGRGRAWHCHKLQYCCNLGATFGRGLRRSCGGVLEKMSFTAWLILLDTPDQQFHSWGRDLPRCSNVLSCCAHLGPLGATWLSIRWWWKESTSKYTSQSGTG